MLLDQHIAAKSMQVKNMHLGGTVVNTAGWSTLAAISVPKRNQLTAEL
jgi:hypothetical protein